jgi:MoaA/NifB/PqqE/SkfB family radical SAM enzyme
VTENKRNLSHRLAAEFLADCANHGIKKVGFTGGEPFLAIDFLRAVTRRAVHQDMRFSRIMTNGVWYRDKNHLKRSLAGLRRAGYDGDIGLSFDAFHRQDVKKTGFFIKEAIAAWNRPDIISLITVRDAKDNETKNKLVQLSRVLNLRIKKLSGNRTVLAGAGCFIKIAAIGLSFINKAADLGAGWNNRRWFADDFCRGPGNVFFVSSNGDVSPCCGYANELAALKIGNIAVDGVKDLLRNARRNRFVRAVFSFGLGTIRKRLEIAGVVFPGKAGNHCFFCYYILTKVPPDILKKCLD